MLDATFSCMGMMKWFSWPMMLSEYLKCRGSPAVHTFLNLVQVHTSNTEVDLGWVCSPVHRYVAMTANISVLLLKIF